MECCFYAQVGLDLKSNKFKKKTQKKNQLGLTTNCNFTFWRYKNPLTDTQQRTFEIGLYFIITILTKRYRLSKWQSKMDNPEKLPT